MTQPNIIIYDIETVPSPEAKDYFAKKRYEAPKNWKDPAKIEAYVMEARHEDMQKAALRWWTGQIVCISVKSLTANWKPKTFIGPDEKAILKGFFTLLEDEKTQVSLIGKNGDTFDRPFILGRALRHSTGVPQSLRPWRPVEDINHIFGFSARCDQIGKLEDYAFGLGIKGKGGHGSDIATWHSQAELGDPKGWEKIATYCAQDVDITAEIMKRWLLPFQTTSKKPKKAPLKAADPIKEEDIPFGSKKAPEPDLAPTHQLSNPALLEPFDMEF